jgi:hypothetical protein
MKKSYEKPVLVRREVLSRVTAANGGGSITVMN